MDTIENMRAMLAVVRYNSFTRAAHMLDIAPSVMTKRIAQLERSIGMPLFNRSTRRVVLTPEGEHHLARILHCVAIYDDAVASARRGISDIEGAIRIKVPSSMCFMRLNRSLHRFAKQHPGVKLEIILMDGPLNPAIGGIDIAVTAFPTSWTPAITCI